MSKVQALLTEIERKANAVKAIWDEAGDELPTGEKKQEIITLNKQIEELESQAKEARENDAQRAANDARLRALREPAGGMVFPGAQAKDARAVVTEAARITLGDAFVTSAEYRGWLDQIAPGGRMNERSRVQSPPVRFKSLFEAKTLITGLSDTQAGAFVFNDVQALVDRAPFRPLTIRDIITKGSTSSDTVEYPVITGITNNAAPVAEATAASGSSGAKPESGLALSRVTETVKTIAHWLPATKRALADAGQIRTLVDNFLRYGLEEELEDQMVNGDGTGENFTGLLTLSTTTPQAWSTNILTTTRKARTLVRTTGRATPTAYVLNPADWETIDLLQDNEARYFFGGPSQIGVPRLWGLPVVESEAMTAGWGMVGDFRQAVLWDREQASIMVSDSHSDFFIRNLVAILAEMRAAFGVLKPAALVKIDLTA